MNDNKGLIRVLAALHDARLPFTEIRDRSGVSNGTTMRRLQELEDTGVVQSTAEMRDDHAIKIYMLTDPAVGEHATHLADLLDL